jgi:hypothetical protein
VSQLVGHQLHFVQTARSQNAEDSKMVLATLLVCIGIFTVIIGYF